jgi:hypothetical protein
MLEWHMRPEAVLRMAPPPRDSVNLSKGDALCEDCTRAEKGSAARYAGIGN